MDFLNYHHLRYFRAIALEGNLTRAAERLRISQSALSLQLKDLEQSLGQALFSRENKALVLTEVGRIALEYANTIFQTGEEMLAVLKSESGGHRRPVRIGAVGTLSRNFQLSFLRPLIGRSDIDLVLHSGNLRDLLVRLRAHTLDLVLSNLPVRGDAETNWQSLLLEEQPVSLVSKPGAAPKRFRFPEDLRNTPLVLPSLDSSVRGAFDLLMEQHRIRPTIAAEVDDMAMLRLLAREGAGLALVPAVVVQDELKNKLLVECCRIPSICEGFYAISPERRFPNPVLAELLDKRRSNRPPSGRKLA